jgi:hypothetical protein
MPANTGRLAALNITVAGTDQQLYAANTTFTTVATLSVCNRNAGVVTVRVALTSSTNVTDADYLLFDFPVMDKETHTLAGIVVGPGQYLYVRSSQTAVNFVLHGYEE